MERGRHAQYRSSGYCMQKKERNLDVFCRVAGFLWILPFGRLSISLLAMHIAGLFVHLLFSTILVIFQ